MHTPKLYHSTIYHKSKQREYKYELHKCSEPLLIITQKTDAIDNALYVHKNEALCQYLTVYVEYRYTLHFWYN